MTGFHRTKEYTLAANEKGAVGEAVVGEAARRVDRPNPLREFVVADRGLDPDAAVRVEARADAHLQRVAGDDGPLEWRPDYELAVERRTATGWVDETTYLAEVKTGDYAAFEREQKRVMEALAARGLDVIAVFVSLDGMPERFGIRIRRFGDDAG